MADLSTGGSGGGDAYTYVQDAQPSGAEEGESWYDTGANAAFVFDGASWIEQTVAAHGDLSGVGTSDHHSKPTSTGNQSANSGWTNKWKVGVGTGSASDDYKDNRSFWVADGVRWDYYNNDGDGSPEDARFWVYGTNGNVVKHRDKSVSEGSGGTIDYSFNPTPVERVRVYGGSYVRSRVKLHLTAMPTHSHNI